MPTYLQQVVNYVRRNPVKSGAAIGGLAGLLLGAGIIAASPTPLSTKWAALDLAITAGIFAGLGALYAGLTRNAARSTQST